MIRYVFFDLDETLLDFKMAERRSIAATLKEFGLDSCDKTLMRYSEINDSLWKRLERGEIKREDVLSERFRILLRELGASVSVSDMRDAYEGRLADSYYIIEGAHEILDALYPRYRLFIASNGIARVQRKRIRGAGIDSYFEKLFISEELHAEKPSREFFERAFQKIDGFRPDQAIIIGDSLTSDIKGGINAGIKTCYFNRGGARPEGIRPGFEIRRLSELELLLENL